MITRCDNSNRDGFEWYGGRGISYDRRWKDFSAFLSDMGEKPDGMSLDRIGVNGNYCKSNCRWATDRQQASNRRTNHPIEYAGLTYTLTQWSSITGFVRTTIHHRLRMGWSVERTLTEPVRTKSGLRHSAVIPAGA